MSTLNTAEGVSNELKSRLAGISVTNGFETDIGLRMFVGRRKLPEEKDIPCAMLIGGRDVPGDRMVRAEVVIAQGYAIWGFDKCDENDPDVKAHMMLRDVKRAIWGDGGDLGRKVKAVNYEGREIAAREDGTGFVQISIVLVVVYSEDLSNP